MSLVRRKKHPQITQKQNFSRSELIENKIDTDLLRVFYAEEKTESKVC